MRFALAALAAVTNATIMNSMDFKFINYVAQHNKVFKTTEEFNFRKQIFEEADREIEEHNQTNSTYTLGHNKFSDWTHEEYKVLLGYRPELRTPQYEDLPAAEYVKSNATSVDWEEKGAVTPVKDQGQCGSCWSFSTTGALEGAHQIATGNLVSYSEMQFVNCDYGLLKNLGCNGGLMDKAFTYAESNAITTEEAYPYVPSKGSCDKSKLEGATLKVQSFVDVKKNDADALKAQLDLGPVSVAIEADKRDFQSYTSGVLSGTGCGVNLDHGVLAVGYGVEDGVEFFRVKNSWGASWGDKGYIKLAVQNDNAAGTCGILSGPPSQPKTN